MSVAASRAIVIVCDALPLELIGCYGNDWVSTAAIDQLASESTVFDQVYPEHPTDGAWWHGRFSTKTEHLFDRHSHTATAIGRLIEEQNLTAALYANHLVERNTDLTHWQVRSFSLADIPRQKWANVEQVRAHREYRLPLAAKSDDPWVIRYQQQLGRENHDATAPLNAMFDAGWEWVEQHRSRPALLWLSVDFDAPWLPPANFFDLYRSEDRPIIRDPIAGRVGAEFTQSDLAGVRAGLAARMSYFDHEVGKFLDRLRQADLFNSTLLILTADRGMPKGEHGILGDSPVCLYEERDHVPLLIHWPEGRQAARNAALLRTADLGPTLAEFFGTPVEDGDGQSLRRILFGEPWRGRDYLCSGLADQIYALRTGLWKLILPVTCDDGVAMTRRLFAKPDDRWEVNDLATTHEVIADRLELQLRRYLDAVQRGTLPWLLPLGELSGNSGE